MRVQDLLIGLIVFSLFTIVILGFGFSMYANMGVTLDNQTNSVMQTFKSTAEATKSDMFGQTIELQNKSISGQGVSTDTSKTFGDNLINAGTNVLIIAGKSFSTINNVMTVTANLMGIDTIFVQSFFAIIVIVIIMIFASSMLRQRI